MEIQRNSYLQKLSHYQHNHLVKIVTGLRRSGKSYLLFRLFKRQLLEAGVQPNHIVEIAFDDFANRKYRNPEVLYDFVKSRITDNEMHYILLDEVQLLDDFVDVLNGFLHMPNADVYVTGSNAKFLSSDIVTEFRGRGVQIHVNPLSFKEFMSVFDGEILHGWRQYQLYGGLPMVVLEKDEGEKRQMLTKLLKETYLSDIVNRNHVQNDAELEDLLRVLASNIGGLTNAMKLSNTFLSEKGVAMSPVTIKRFTDYFIDSFLIERAMRFDVKGKKYINTPVKYYFSDMGLRNAVLGFRQIEPTHIMENILFNELCCRGFQVDVGVVTHYTKNATGTTQRQQLEIDFVCNNGMERIYIQSALSLPDSAKLQQEQRSLTLTADSFAKTIITGDNVPRHQLDNGIVVENIYEFLLGNTLN